MSGLLDLVNSPWALEPGKLGEVVAIYCAHVRGEKLDLKAIEAQLGHPLANEQGSYQVTDGVAVIDVEGVLAKRMNMMSRISGGASTELIGQELDKALADARVHSILLAIDSPGGAVDGTQTLANKVFNARGVKPIVALGSGSMTSGAYWIGSAASEVYISSDTDIVGSIGVAMKHVDVSKSQEKIGVKTTDIYSGKYKRMGSENAPLTEEAAAYLQTLCDDMYTVFVDAVARNRGVDTQTVVENMADGRLFIGQSAISAGLVDGVSTLEQLIADMAAGIKPASSTPPSSSQQARAAGGVPATQAGPADAGVASDEPATPASSAVTATPQLSEGDGMSINRAFLNANHAALVAEILAEGHAAGVLAGAAAELARIQAVEAAALPGHSALISKLKFDGKTTGPEAAAQIITAERGKLGKKAEDILSDAGELTQVTATPAANPAASPAAPAAGASLEERCKAKWDADAKLRAEFADNFKTYLAFEKGSASGRLKILGA